MSRKLTQEELDFNKSKRRELLEAEFIRKSIEKHGDKYDYSLVVYRRADEKVKIICPVHGIVEQTPTWHMNGSGCTKCGNSTKSSYKKISLDEFIGRANTVHKSKYDYSKVEYKDCDTKVEILCKEHGKFMQTTYAHTNMRQGCPICGKELGIQIIKDKIQLTTEEFIRRATLLHGNLYDYSLVDYQGLNTPVTIICRQHGVFKQKSGNHLRPAGCQRCAKRGFKVEDIGTLYILNYEDITKVGITNRRVSDRRDFINRKSGLRFSIIDNYFINGVKCRDIEQAILRYLKLKYHQPSKYFHGYSECFYDVDIDDLKDKIQEEINKINDI